jgi:membrane associated rhomboid family serine protease
MPSYLPPFAEMEDYDSPGNDLPITWLRGHPVYAAHLIVLAFVASMLVTTVLIAFNANGFLLAWVTFDSAAVLRGQAWRIATYGLYNPPSLMFAIDMVMIALFGREVEKFFGRRKFLTLFAGIYLLSPVLYTVIGLWVPTRIAGETGAFALFVAFAALYPEAMMIFGILAKWAALVLVGIYSLMALAYHDWVGLAALWATSAFAFAFVRYERGLLTLPRLWFPQRRPKFRVLTGGRAAAAEPASPSRTGSMAEVDALLDKIARSGISSLTHEERATLDSARERLARRDSGR